jgi:DinB superfamily
MEARAWSIRVVSGPARPDLASHTGCGGPITIDLDPVSAPDAYRASLLAALGGDDPAEVQAATPGLLRDLVAGAGELLRTAPAPGEWSAADCLVHLFDGELIVAVRSRWILAEDEPDIVGYDQALWVSRLGEADDDPTALVAAFEAVRRSNLALWARTPVATRGRVGRHRERGPESYELTFRLAAGHDRIHLVQARAALDAARSVAASG